MGVGFGGSTGAFPGKYYSDGGGSVAPSESIPVILLYPTLLWGSRALSQCDCRLGGRNTWPGRGWGVYLWLCKEVDVFYIVELGIDI